MAMSLESATEDWQTTKKSLVERNKHMLNNTLLSDVNFLVGDGTSSKNFPAHKYVLAISSPVFYAMFYGDLAEQDDTIKITDAKPDEFQQFLQYIYTDEVSLSKSLVAGVIYLANKYMIPDLTNKCWGFLSEELDDKNVISTLVLAEGNEKKELVEKCWSHMEENTHSVLQQEEFAEAPYEIVKELFEKDVHNSTEVELFQAMDRWAVKQCEKNGEIVDRTAKRRYVSELIYTIHYPSISHRDFIQYVLKSELFEVSDLSYLAELVSCANPDIPTVHSEISKSSNFKSNQRKGRMHRLARYSKRSGKDNNPVGDALLNFVVSRSIRLIGINIYGNKGRSAYIMSLQLQSGDGTCIAKVPQQEYNVYRERPLQGFDVLFNAPVRIEAGVLYTLAVSGIEGPRSYVGDSEIGDQTCNGVNFNFFQKRGEIEGPNSHVGDMVTGLCFSVPIRNTSFSYRDYPYISEILFVM